jgi:hypothetical protein
MKKIVLIVLTFTLMLGGCGGMQNKEVTKKGSVEPSDAAALQDEFTSEFIDTSVEVEEGYLQFRSKTGGYMMLYPKDAIAHPTAYETNGDRYEVLKYTTAKKNNMSLIIFATYELNKNTKETDIYLDMLSGRNGYEGNFDKIDEKEKNVYIGTQKHITESKELSSFRVLGFVQSKNTNQAVRYEYNLICYEEQKGCNYDETEILNGAFKLMESITFITPNE